MSLPVLDGAALLALASKYRELERLRARRVGAEARQELRSLAERFPGALRELESMPTREITGRAVALEAAAASGKFEPWMRCVHAYHAMLRAALALRAGAEADELRRGQAAAWLDDGLIAAFRRPRGGRLVLEVIDRLARELGLEPGAVRAYVASGSCSQNSMRRGTL